MLKKLAGETAIYGVSSILSRLLNYVILTPYLTNVFLRGEYGVVSDMYVYAGLLMVLFTYRMETTFFRFGTKGGEDRERVFSTALWSLLFSTVVLVAVLYHFAPEIAAFLHYPEHPEYVWWFIFIIGFDAMSAVPFARLRLENKAMRFALLKTLGILVNIFFIFFFLEIVPRYFEAAEGSRLSFLFDESNRITFVFVANLIASAVVLLLLLPEFRHLKMIFDKALWKQMMIYAMPLVVVGFAGVTNQLISIPLIKTLLPYSIEENLAQAGVYAASMKIAVLMSLFTQAFNYAAEPFFFRHAKRKDAKETYAQVAQAFALVGSLVFLGIMMYIDIIQYFIGKDFREGLNVVPILLLAFLMLGLYYNFSIWYKLTDRTRYGAYISLIGVVITLALNVLLIPHIGYIGGAWAALACYGTMALLSYLWGQKYFSVDYPVGKILFYIGSSVLVFFISTKLSLAMDRSLLIRLLTNTFLLLSWVLGIYFLERDSFRQMNF